MRELSSTFLPNGASGGPLMAWQNSLGIFALVSLPILLSYTSWESYLGQGQYNREKLRNVWFGVIRSVLRIMGEAGVVCERIYSKSKQLQFIYFKHVEGLLCLKSHAAQEFWFMRR